jgi:hypothetical protein
MPTKRGHNVGWDEARILRIVSNSRKYKDSAHVARLTSPISQSRLNILILHISNEVTRGQYDVTDFSCVSIDFSLQCFVFTPQMALAVGTKSF